MKTLVRTLTLSLGCVLFCWAVLAQQNPIDSLQNALRTQKADTNRVNTLIALSEEFIQSRKYDNALRYANEAVTLAGKLNFGKGRAEAYIAIGLIYYWRNKGSEARKNYFISLKISELAGDKKGIASAYYYIAKSFLHNNDPEALRYAYLLLKFCQASGNKIHEASAFELIGVVFVNQEEYAEALKMYVQSLKIWESINIKYAIAQTRNTIANIYSNQGNYTEALQNSLVALKIIRAPGFDGPHWSLPHTYRVLGGIYKAQGDSASRAKNNVMAARKYKEALTNYQAALEIYKKNEQKAAVAGLEIRIGNIYLKQNNLASAKTYLTNGVLELKELGEVEDIDYGYNSLAKLDSAQGDFKLAYQHYKLYVTYRDSLNDEDKTKKLVQVKMQYEFDKKESIAKAEQEKRDLLEQRNRNKQFFIMLLLLLLVLVSILIAFIQWRNNRQKQRMNVVLQQQKETVEQTLTDLKTTQTQLVQKEKMASLGELTAGIAHEIQNPLNFVNNFSELSSDLVEELEEEHQKPQRDADLEVELLTDLKDNLHKILHHGNRAASIVKGMLEHARSSTGERETTDLNKLADEFLRLAYHGMRGKDETFNCELVTEFDPDLGLVTIMPQEIGRVLLNLYNNAFYAVRQRQQTSTDASYQPTVNVATSRVNGQVVIRVGDNGMGMPEGVKAKIFQPFFTTKPTGEGTGLGLSLSYDIVTKGHGGSLTVTSQEGQGTEFVLSFPSGSTLS